MKEWYHKLGKRLFTIALEHSRRAGIKRDVREAIRPIHKGVARSGPRKGWTLNRKADEVLLVALAISNRRTAKRKPAGPRASLAVRLERFRLQKREDVKERFARVYWHAGFRKAGAGDHTLKVNLCSAFNKVTGSGYSESGSRYSSRYTYRKTDSHHSFVIPANWVTTIYDRDLEFARGLVLAAVKIPTSNGLTFYRAKWVEQGRGFSLEFHSGILGISGTDVFAAEQCDLCGKLTSRRGAPAHRKACPEHKRQVVERAMEMGV